VNEPLQAQRALRRGRGEKRREKSFYLSANFSGALTVIASLNIPAAQSSP
jgi:hypothetical protein